MCFGSNNDGQCNVLAVLDFVPAAIKAGRLVSSGLIAAPALPLAAEDNPDSP